MPRKSPSLKVKVKDEGLKQGKRRLTAEIVGEGKLFESSDTFAERGTIPKLTDTLTASLTKEVHNYFQKGSEMMDLVDETIKNQSLLRKQAANE